MTEQQMKEWQELHPCGCKPFLDMPGLYPGWGCCKCQVYNNIMRDVCKSCGHDRTADRK